MQVTFSPAWRRHVRVVLKPALWLGVAVPLCSAKLVELPTSDRYYRAIVNATIGIDRYLDNVPSEALVTDFTIYLKSGSMQLGHIDRMQSMYKAVSRLLAAARPRAIVGTYHSSRDVNDGTVAYPPRGVSPLDFRADQLITYRPASIYDSRRYVDYSRADTRAKLIQQVASEVAATGRPLVFLDNVSHSCAGWPIPWSTTLEYLGELGTALHAQGIRAVANVAWAIGGSGCTETSAKEFVTTGLDGVALEMSLTDEVRRDLTKLKSAIQQYRTLLDAGLTVILISTADDRERAANTILLAAFGLMFRKPGDKLFIAWPFFGPAQNWFHWPADFSAPRGSPSIVKQPNGDLVMERAFQRAKVTINLNNGKVIVNNARQGAF